jgi:hypothetical protein
MERGDLAVSVRPHYVVVLEGVLVILQPITVERRFHRGEKVVGWNLNWLDIPLRRLATLKRRYPDFGVDIITFTDDDTAGFASDFLNQTGIPYDSLAFAPRFDQWTQTLPFRDGLAGIYDSDSERLERYGQYGRAVILGEDW